MADIATISALLTSVKTATDIAKLVKDSNASLENAEIKLNMADLISALADVKIELADVQSELISKDATIHKLQQDLAQKAVTKFDGKMYWVENDKVPFCTVCYEKDSKYHHLTFNCKDEWDDDYWHCKICDNSYFK